MKSFSTGCRHGKTSHWELLLCDDIDDKIGGLLNKIAKTLLGTNDILKQIWKMHIDKHHKKRFALRKKTCFEW